MMGDSARTRFRHARFYITFRCNARCGYCNVWQDPVFFGHDELAPDDLRRCLDQVRELGVEYVDFTGGEPSLHRHLAVAVRHARQIGLRVEVTTNAIRFARHADDIVPYVDALNISIDTLSAQRYHAIRGVDTLHRTVTLVERLRSQQAANIKLIAVITSQTLAGMDDLIGFAQANKVPVYLSPVFEYFDGQSEYRERTRAPKPGRPSGRPVTPPAGLPVDRGRLLAAVRARTHTPYTIVNLDFLRLIETLDPSAPTACGAGSRILTVGPDGRLLLPCYHEWNSSLGWDRPYRDLVQDPEFVRVRDTEVGQLPGCRSCAVFPYIGLASSYRLTVDFLVQAVTTEINKLKSCLHGLDGPWQPAPDGLGPATQQLLDRLAGLSLRPGTHLDELYHFSAVPGRGAASDLAAGPVAVEEVLADHANEDCWRVQRTPHRLARQLYLSVVPALAALAGRGSAEARRLALDSLRAHLCLWEAWLDLFPPAGSAGPSGRGRAELTEWCLQAGDLLAAAVPAGEPLAGGQAGERLSGPGGDLLAGGGLADAARSVTAIALLTDIPAARLFQWGGLASHPDELFLASMLMRGLGMARRTALAPCFSKTLARVLARPRQPDQRSRHPGTGPEADLARAADGDPAELANLRGLGWRHCMAGDTMAFRRLVRAWKAASDGDDSGRLERMLLAAELGVDAEPRTAAGPTITAAGPPAAAEPGHTAGLGAAGPRIVR
jgi:MoaA/NifB/PqqE/SkfB family radical SAM enzyme